MILKQKFIKSPADEEQKKIEVQTAIEEGKTIKEISSIYGVNQNTISYFIRKHNLIPPRVSRMSLRRALDIEKNERKLHSIPSIKEYDNEPTELLTKQVLLDFTKDRELYDLIVTVAEKQRRSIEEQIKHIIEFYILKMEDNR